MRKEIKYIGFYDIPNSDSSRVCDLAAINKMNYVTSVMNRCGYKVNIISPSWISDNKKVKFEKRSIKKINENTKVTFCSSWSTSSKIARNFKICFTLIWLFFYLVIHTEKSEKVLAYHVQWISLPIRAAKFFKRFELILEVEEIYQDVMMVNSLFIKWESKLLESANSYLLSSDLLSKKFDIEKPKLAIYGDYEIKEYQSEPIDDGKIHLLYAGIIDSHKKGAFNAVESTKFLTDEYVLHIIGFGEVEKLRKRIQELNITNKCKIIFGGTKSGDEYFSYIQGCHIGLSTQSMTGEYLNSSFPSKILSYLSNGLRVVTCYIECVYQSDIGDMVTYYYEDKPEKIAEAILSIDTKVQYNSRKRLKEMDMKLIKDIKFMLEDS